MIRPDCIYTSQDYNINFVYSPYLSKSQIRIYSPVFRFSFEIAIYGKIKNEKWVEEFEMEYSLWMHLE